MTILQLLEIANSGYPDGDLAIYFDQKTGERIESSGDGLAEFIVVELTETFYRKAKRNDQLDIAIGAMERAVNDLCGVISALKEAKRSAKSSASTTLS